MSSFDTATAVLGKASLLDARMPQPDTNIARAWAEALGDVNLDDALTAITEHYRQPSAERIGPGDILDRVRRIRAERIRTADSSLFEPHDVDPDNLEAYQAARRERISAVASGLSVPEAPNGAARPVTALLESTAARLPSMPRALPAADLAKKRVVDTTPINPEPAAGPVRSGT